MSVQVEVPQVGVEVQKISDDVVVLMLVFTCSGNQSKFYLCEANQNYQDIAKKIHDGICTAGREARRAKSGLITVTSLPDSLKNGIRNDH